MKTTTRRVTVALIMIISLLIALYFVASYTATVQNRATLTALDNTISNHERELTALAEATRINRADAATERIIVDCQASERVRFDKLLDLLSQTITPVELTELNRLFYKCGGFYADQKSVMATRLFREVEIMEQYYSLRTIVSGENKNQSKKLAAWKNVAEAELKTAEYFNQLVILQGNIISELTAGTSATASSMVATLNEVSSIRGQMLVLSKQIEVQKAEALNL